VAKRPERAEGPILGTLYTLNGSVLKLTAQLLPVGDTDPRQVRLQLRSPGGPWEDGPAAPVGPGFAAASRLDGWDGAADREYQVVWGPGTAQEQRFGGRWPPTRWTPASWSLGCWTAPSTASGRSTWPATPARGFPGRGRWGCTRAQPLLPLPVVGGQPGQTPASPAGRGRRPVLRVPADRQERFLAGWADADPGTPKICLSQTLWGCLQTDERGRAQFDADADAAVPARRTALGLVKRAGALLLSGDQHLASLVRHGLDGFDDGPVQFVAPAAGSAWQRWFEPAGGLPNPGPTPHTGDFTDAYGNRMRVLAVANSGLTKAAFRAARPGRNSELGDRDLKRDGYGLVRVDKAGRQFVIECHPADGGPQFAGWPYQLPFTSGT
jgi:hypothetical protein